MKSLVKKLAVGLLTGLLILTVRRVNGQELENKIEPLSPVNISAYNYEAGDRVEYSLTDFEKIYKEKLNQKMSALNVDEAYASWLIYFEDLENWQKYTEERVFVRPAENKIPDDLFDEGTKGSVVAKVYDLWAKHKAQAGKINEKERIGISDIYQKIQKEKIEYDAYESWKENKFDAVRNFAEDWLKRARGKRFSIEGITYLVTKEPLNYNISGVVILVADRVTPYDILKNDGSLKRPI